MRNPCPALVSNHVARHHFDYATMLSKQGEKRDPVILIKIPKNECSGHTCRLWNQQNMGLHIQSY